MCWEIGQVGETCWQALLPGMDIEVMYTVRIQPARWRHYWPVVATLLQISKCARPTMHNTE